MSNKIECVCVFHATRSAAHAYLGATQKDVLETYQSYRKQLCQWWSIEDDNWEELPDEAHTLLRGYWNLLNLPWQVTAETVTGKRADQNCWCCLGEGEVDYTKLNNFEEIK